MTTDEDKKIYLPNGDEADSTPHAHTERGIEREEEEKKFISVIIKRNDEVVKHPDDVLEMAIREGMEQIKRPAVSLLLSALSSGLILGFAVMAVSFANDAVPDAWGPAARRLAMALVYPLGFVICIMSGAQLFTEHTALAVYPYLDRRCTFLQLHRLWLLVLIGNLVGTAFSALLIYHAGPVTKTYAGYISITNHLLEFEWYQIFISAILAGWLMSLGGWLILATPPSNGQIICIYIVTFLIGIGGLHHSIVGSAELFMGFFLNKSLEVGAAIKFLSSAIVGNLVGGSFFVAILNYAHIRKTQEID